MQCTVLFDEVVLTTMLRINIITLHWDDVTELEDSIPCILGGIFDKMKLLYKFIYYTKI